MCAKKTGWKFNPSSAIQPSHGTQSVERKCYVSEIWVTAMSFKCCNLYEVFWFEGSRKETLSCLSFFRAMVEKLQKYSHRPATSVLGTVAGIESLLKNLGALLEYMPTAKITTDKALPDWLNVEISENLHVVEFIQSDIRQISSALNGHTLWTTHFDQKMMSLIRGEVPAEWHRLARQFSTSGLLSWLHSFRRARSMLGQLCTQLSASEGERPLPDNGCAIDPSLLSRPALLIDAVAWCWSEGSNILPESATWSIKVRDQCLCFHFFLSSFFFGFY